MQPMRYGKIVAENMQVGAFEGLDPPSQWLKDSYHLLEVDAFRPLTR